VQRRLEFVFRKFSELHSAKAVMRELRQHDLSLPVRPLRGPAPHEIAWMPATSARVLQVLHNPAYAGARRILCGVAPDRRMRRPCSCLWIVGPSASRMHTQVTSAGRSSWVIRPDS
jgi:hypothetical protein